MSRLKITQKPQELPTVPPQPTHYDDVEWATFLLKDEAKWKDLSGELDEFDSLDDETDDEEESA